MNLSSRARLGTIVAGLSLLAAPAYAASPAAELRDELGPGTTVIASAETGPQVTFVGTDPGASIPLDADSPRPAATEALDRFAGSFGLHKGAELVLSDVSGTAGRHTVRFQQTVDDVPVLGGQLVVNLDSGDDLLSIGGELEPAAGVDTTPELPAGQADDIAIDSVARGYGVSPDDLDIAEQELSIFDSRILGGPGLEIPRLVWRFSIVDDPASPTIREFVLVDAELGAVAVSFSEIEELKVRRVCDAANQNIEVPCQAAAAEREEGEVAAAEAQVNTAYNLSGAIYDYYLSRFNRDGINGTGGVLISTVRRLDAAGNAFWNGTQMIYGNGNVTEDIAGHELAHGVTDHESSLFYYYESGAINESMSDVFGELFDLGYSSPSLGADLPANDEVADRWLIGEGSAIGVIRDMEHPPNHADPDQVSDAAFVTAETNLDPSSGDAGGVHTNSGVNNKATFLLTDGGLFNGRTVTALGATKVARLYYEVNSNLLNSASDYQDLGAAMRQACSTLAGAGTDGFTAADCTEVNDAVVATEMDLTPATAAAPAAAVCPTPGEVPTNAYFDDFETAPNGTWTVTQTVASTAFYPQNPNPHFDTTYARSGSKNLWILNRSGASDSKIAMASSLTIPAGAMLHFNHAHGFKSTLGEFYDGGVVEYSTNGGGTWTNAGPLLTANGYNAAINKATNPLGQVPAFVSDSKGYTATRADLSSLSGQSVRFRFRFASAAFAWFDYGWFIDDVRIYTCAPPPDTTPPDTSISSGPSGSTTTRDATFTYAGTAGDVAKFECQLTGEAGFSECPLAGKSYTALADGAYTFSVRAVDTAGNADASPAAQTFTVTTASKPEVDCSVQQAAYDKAKKKVKKLKAKVKKLKDDGTASDLEKAIAKLKKAKKKKKAAKQTLAACLARAVA